MTLEELEKLDYVGGGYFRIKAPIGKSSKVIHGPELMVHIRHIIKLLNEQTEQTEQTEHDQMKEKNTSDGPKVVDVQKDKAGES